MKEDLVLELIREVLPVVIKKLGKPVYGIVHKREEVEINGVKGFLVWDYIIWNEITFEDMDGNYFSFLTSASDEKTEETWNELVAKYRVCDEHYNEYYYE